MTMMTFLVFVAVLCVIGSLGSGVVAMVRHGKVGHRTSTQWMTMRVTFQALAVVLVLLALWA